MTRFRPETLNGVPVPYDEPFEVLRSQISKPGPEAWAAIRALAEHPGPAALATLVDLTRWADPYLRSAAVEAIGCHESGRDAGQTLDGMLGDESGFVVRSACRAAATLGLASAHDRVHELVGANDENTQLAALAALEVLWHPSDFETVFARYLHDRSDDVRKQAAWTLNKNVGPEHWRRVFAAWSRDPLPRHRAWACSLAEKFGDRTVLLSLEPLRTDSNGHVRSAAGRAAKVLGER